MQQISPPFSVSTPSTTPARLSSFKKVSFANCPTNTTTLDFAALEKIEEEVKTFSISTEEDLALASRVRRIIELFRPVLINPQDFKDPEKALFWSELKLNFLMNQLRSHHYENPSAASVQQEEKKVETNLQRPVWSQPLKAPFNHDKQMKALFQEGLRQINSDVNAFLNFLHRRK